MKQRNVSIGELVVTADKGEVLVAVGLGSCVGVALYDPTSGLAALAHVMLPDSRGERHDTRFADVAIPAAVEEMTSRGAVKTRIRAAIAGGAAMFNFGPSAHIRIGEQNIQACTRALEALAVPIVASDTGGSSGRTLSLVVATGEVFVKTPGSQAKLLASLAPGREEVAVANAA